MKTTLLTLTTGILLVSMTSACVPLIIGGAAAAGGYFAGQDTRKVGTIADDISITAEIKSFYLKDDIIRSGDIKVDTFNGVVTLYGHVPDKTTREHAIFLARQAKGIKEVISKLTIR